MPNGKNYQPKRARGAADIVQRVRQAVLKAMDVLHDNGQPLHVLLAAAAQDNPLKFIEVASKYIPKDIDITVNKVIAVQGMSDSELLEIIRARQERTIDALPHDEGTQLPQLVVDKSEEPAVLP